MTEFDPALHSERMHDLAAVQFEMLDPELDAEKIRAEFADSNLCKDPGLSARTSEEASRLQAHAGKMAALWRLMIEAEKARSEALSSSTAAEMRRAILEEHRRRNGIPASRPRPRRRATINLTDPASAARTILAKTDTRYVAALISALRGGADAHAGGEGT